MTSSPGTAFPASYDTTTRIISGAVTAVCLLIMAVVHHVVVAGLLILLIVACYAWSPRGYAISQRSIIVKRLIGSVRIPLDGIQEARPAAAGDFENCTRLFGNGGLFGYYGLFRTAKLGNSTWYVTNRNHSVIVKTDARTSVLSPDDVDGFLAAIRASVPAPIAPPGGPSISSLPSGRSPLRFHVVATLVAVSIAIVALTLVAAVTLYSPGPPGYTLSPDSLTIHDRFYPVTLNARAVDLDRIRVVDIDSDADWRPVRRANGFATSHYRSGWFRAANGQEFRMYRAQGRRLVLLPPKSDGNAVLVETADPEKFVAEVRQQWSRELVQ